MLIIIIKALIMFLLGDIFGLLTGMLIDKYSNWKLEKWCNTEKRRIGLKVKTRELIMHDRASL